jgi:hypothetical protein
MLHKFMTFDLDHKYFGHVREITYFLSAVSTHVQMKTDPKQEYVQVVLDSIIRRYFCS